MEKSIKSLINIMVYMIATVTVIAALVANITIHLWVVVVFFIGVFAASRILDHIRKPKSRGGIGSTDKR